MSYNYSWTLVMRSPWILDRSVYTWLFRIIKSLNVVPVFDIDALCYNPCYLGRYSSHVRLFLTFYFNNLCLGKCWSFTILYRCSCYSWHLILDEVPLTAQVIAVKGFSTSYINHSEFFTQYNTILHGSSKLLSWFCGFIQL